MTKKSIYRLVCRYILCESSERCAPAARRFAHGIGMGVAVSDALCSEPPELFGFEAEATYRRGLLRATVDELWRALEPVGMRLD